MAYHGMFVPWYAMVQTYHGILGMVIPRGIPWYGSTMVYHEKLPCFFGYGNTIRYTMVEPYHGIPRGITIPKKPW